MKTILSHFPYQNYGKLRFCKNLNLLQVETQPNPPPLFDVIDGAALVHMLPMATITTFDQYAELVFISHLAGQLEKCSRELI